MHYFQLSQKYFIFQGQHTSETMKPLVFILFSVLCSSFAAEDSCVGRCLRGFDKTKKCQCEPMCAYYESCCADYHTICKTKVGRGDVFNLPEDEYDYPFGTEATPLDLLTDSPTTELTKTGDSEDGFGIPKEQDSYPTFPKQEEDAIAASNAVTVSKVNQSIDTPVMEEEVLADSEELCSEKPFDAFTDQKNGSIYAFRGKYFYELNKTSVLPGYPKQILDVWGIEGPIDAAFTRINCQGKTYIFKGKEYWRFDDGVLEPGYPRLISDGFDYIPSNIDAAFALPAKNFHGQERVYFFKGEQYWQYDFVNQPSWADCETTSQSLVFDRYAQLQGDSFEDLFGLLFGSRFSETGEHNRSPRNISRDWKGIPSGIDAAMAGRIYLTRPSKSSKKKFQRRKPSWWGREDHKRRGFRVRSDRSLFSDFDLNFGSDSHEEMDWHFQPTVQCTPVQSVYFFVKGNACI
ncbi:vitronectin [Protopterus annectens]|uniref:vitronectin n=1 Tax=Protopterus annectens TaxID=7888 RepID=UPI001CFB113E|nr:vitronectin [Protopterus annectens]